VTIVSKVTNMTALRNARFAVITAVLLKIEVF